jgi:hypothetical protein
LRAKAVELAISATIMIAISVRTQSSLHPQIFRGLLAAVFNDVEGNLAALDKAIGARLPNGLDMYKHILAAAGRRNKAVTLRDVEPLDRPARDLRSPFDTRATGGPTLEGEVRRRATP